MQASIDKALIEKCQAGDREGFRALFEIYRDRVYSIALYFSTDAVSAKDITQEVFLRLFTRIKQFRGDSSFETWLYRLVVNCCIDERRKSSKLLPLDFLMRRTNMEQKTGIEHDYLRAELTEATRAAVQKLKPKLRLPVVLRYVDELSYDQIAAVLGCSQGAVASRLSRAHRTLARTLGYLLDRSVSARNHVV